jgi:hypothetical protein
MAEQESPAVFRGKVWNALQHLLAVAMFAVCHWLLDKLLTFTNPGYFKPALDFLKVVAFVAFSLIYLFILYEMVLLFCPAELKQFLRRGLKKKSSAVAADVRGAENEES